MIRVRCPVKTEQVQLGEDGVVAIPAAYRKAMGLRGGEMLQLRLDDEGLHIQSQRQAIAQAQAIVRRHVTADRSLSNELIAERRLAAKRESELDE